MNREPSREMATVRRSRKTAQRWRPCMPWRSLPMRLRARPISRTASVFATVVAILGATTIGRSLHAQQLGSIRGRVMVEGINRPLGAAQVSVVGTQIGAQTNDNGEYRLNNVPPGPRTVRVQRIGFAAA